MILISVDNLLLRSEKTLYDLAEKVLSILVNKVDYAVRQTIEMASSAYKNEEELWVFQQDWEI